MRRRHFRCGTYNRIEQYYFNRVAVAFEQSIMLHISFVTMLSHDLSEMNSYREYIFCILYELANKCNQ